MESWTVTEIIASRPEYMNQKDSQQDTQPNNAPLEEQQPALKSEATQAARHEPGSRQMYHCANCDIEFFWPPTLVQNTVYCCTGCAAGGPCNCDYSLYRPAMGIGVIHCEQ
jgi:hypothetical protein